MNINTNVVSINSQRVLAANSNGTTRAIERLSSGLRINSARDDAAGLAISSRMLTQIKGMTQAARNANDGISLLQTAEGALVSLTSSLQRARELSIQAANGTNGSSDRAALATEVQQLMQEIQRISSATTFNGQQVFSQSAASIRGDPNKAAVIDGLKLSWLEEAETRIRTYFGLQGDGAAMGIELSTFSDGAGGTAARVVGSGADGQGHIGNVRMQIDMADFVPPNLPNGGNAPFYNDRIIAHEMTHAVQYRTLNVASMTGGAAATSTWFLEGMAEFIHGADERVAGDITAEGSVANLIANNSISNWGGTSGSYSTAYIAIRYLHDQMKSAGYAGGLKDFLGYMSANAATLDTAFNHFFGFNHAQFRTNFAAAAVNFVNTRMNLTNGDTGAVGGLDADGGATYTAQSILANVGSRYGDDVLDGFRETFETVGTGESGSQSLSFHVGANANQTIDVALGAVNLSALGLDDLNVEGLPQRATVQLDFALNYINSQRAKIGAQLSRMETAITSLQSATENVSASRSRIIDADYAEETATLVRSQILQRAAAAMVAQANALPQLALALLR